LTAVALGLLTAAVLVALLRSGPLVRPAVDGPAPPRKTFWRVAGAPARAPALTTPAPSPSAPLSGPALIVHVEDATGGPIGGAQIRVGDRLMGVTDADGVLRIPATADGLLPAGELKASAAGYAAGQARYISPGEARIKLLPGSQLSGVVVEAGSERLMPGLRVITDDAETTTDEEGRFAFRDLQAGSVRLEARGPHHFGALKVPVAVGLGRVVSGLRIEVSPAFAIRGRVLVEGRPVTADLEVQSGGTQSRVDGEGRYELVGLAPGRYQLDLHDRQHGLFAFKSRAEVDVIDRDVTRDIELGARHSVMVDVVDPDGRPVADVDIGATQQDATMLVGTSGKTDAAGRCTFDGLKRGEVIFDVHIGLQPKRKVQVPASQPVRFVLDGSGRIAGRLTSGRGRAPRPRGLVLDGPRSGGWTASSGADGGFDFDHLPAGRYSLLVYARQGMIPPDYGAEATLELDLAPAEQRTGIRVVLPDEDARITGRVLDAAGQPVADVLVSCMVSYKNLFTNGRWVPAEPLVVSDTGGHFALDGLSRFYRYTVMAYRPNGEQASVENVAADSAVTLRLTPLASLVVLLRDVQGRAQAGVIEVLDGDEVVAWSASARAGDVIRFDSLRPGQRRVRLDRAARTADVAVDLKPGAAVTVTVIVPP
jgi:protocatechuate 3,4-dioxygenase beta subunit